MRSAFFDMLAAIGLGLITWGLWEYDTRIARAFLGMMLVAIGVGGSYVQARKGAR